MEAFIGKWHTTGKVAAGPDSPGMTVTATDIYEWLPGGYSIIHYVEGNIGDDKIHSIEIIGYDSLRNAYFAPFFNHQGGAGWEIIRADGKTWTWQGENVMGVNYHRCRAVFSNDGNTIEARHERSDDGENWKLWMDVTLVKE